MAIYMMQLGGGILILVVATHFLITLSKRLSRAARISPLIVGITVVAVGTSLPELSVSTVAVMQNDTGLAMGNIIGSNIINVFLVLAFSILVSNFRIGNTKTQRNILLLYAVTLLFIFLHAIAFPPLFSGLLLLSLAVAVTASEYRWAVEGRSHEDKVFFKHAHAGKMTVWELMKGLFLVAAIIIGGILVVGSTEQISLLSGYSTTVLGLSLTAIATSIPELLATFVSREEKEEKIAIGNIIGSNMYNLLLIGGIITLFSPRQVLTIAEAVWLVVSGGIFLAVIRYYHGKVIPKRMGVVLLVFLFLYLYFLSIK